MQSPTLKQRDRSQGSSGPHGTIRADALGSRSLSRNGEGSMALNNCFNSPTCTSMTEHLGGIGSPEEALSLVPEAYVITLARLLQSEVYPVASPHPPCRCRSPVRHYFHGFPAVPPPIC